MGYFGDINPMLDQLDRGPSSTKLSIDNKGYLQILSLSRGMCSKNFSDI